MNPFMIIKNQQTLLTLAVGIAVVLIVIISYLPIWQPRVPKKYWITEKSSWSEVFRQVPWILVITYVGIAVMTVVLLAYYAYNPPNW